MNDRMGRARGVCPGNPGVAFRAPRGLMPGDATPGDTGHHRGASTPQTAPRRPEPPGAHGGCGQALCCTDWAESQLQPASVRRDLASQAPCVRPRDYRDRLLGALVLLLGWSGGALSQSNSDPGVGLGVHAAYTRSRDAAAGRLSGGIQLRARLTGGLGLEGLASYREEEYEIAGERVLKLAMVPVQGSLQVFFLSSKPIQPYLLAGIGYYYVRASGLGSRSDTGRKTENKFGAHAGAGIDARVARKVTVHADLRYVFIDVDAVRALTEPGPTERRSDFWHGRAGISFHF